MDKNTSNKQIGGFSIKQIGEAFDKLCILHGKSRSFVAENSGINIQSLHGFINGRGISNKKLTAFIKTLDENTTLNVKTPADIIKRASEFPKLPTHEELRKIFSAILKEKAITTRQFKQLKREISPGTKGIPGKNYEYEYWQAIALGYDSLGDMLIKEADIISRISEQPTAKLPDDPPTKPTSKIASPTLGEYYRIVCRSEGIRTEFLAADTALNEGTILNFFNSKERTQESTIEKVRIAINNSTHLNFKNDRQVIQYAREIIKSGSMTKENIQRALCVVAQDRGLSLDDIAIKSSNNVGSRHLAEFEKEYFMAKYLGYESIKELLTDPKVLDHLNHHHNETAPPTKKGDSLIIAVKKLADAGVVSKAQLRLDTGLATSTFNNCWNENRFSVDIRNRFPEIISRHCVYSTEEEIIHAANQLDLSLATQSSIPHIVSSPIQQQR